MKNLFKLFAFFMLGFVVITSSCKKDRDNGEEIPVTPSDYTTTTILGMVYDENHNAIGNVDVTIGNNTFTTSWDGKFMKGNISVKKDRFMAKFIKANYFQTVRTEKTVAGGITRLNVTMIYKPSAMNTTITPSVGGELVVSSYGKITFPAGLNYVNKDGTVYTGTVYVHAKYLDPLDENYSRLVPGGDQYGIHKEGTGEESEVMLSSMGGMIIELSDGSGELLNLDENNDSLVTIRTAIPAALQVGAPDSIDTWFSGGNMAYSSNEGKGRKEGGEYISQVGHFTYWSLEIPQSGHATIKGHVVNDMGNAVSGVRVMVGQSYAVTDNNGYYERIVPSGIITGIMVQVMPIDFNNITSNIVHQSALSDGEVATVDLTLNTSGVMREIKGRFVNCSGFPVAGEAFISQGSYTAQTYTLDGSFSILVPASWTYFTLKCNVNGTVKDVYINTPTSDPHIVGDIQICPPPAGSNSVTVASTTFNSFNASTCHFYVSGNSLSIYVSDGGSNYMSFEVGTYSGAGTYNLVEYLKSATAHVELATGYYQLQSGTLTISQDGGVGGRVIGTFSGTAVSGEAISGKFNSLREADNEEK